MNSATWGFIGVLAGGLINTAAEFLRTTTSKNLSQVQRDHEVRIQNDNFQRDNLLNLQDSLGSWKLIQIRTTDFDRDSVATDGCLSELPKAIKYEIKTLKPLMNIRIARTTNETLRTELVEIMCEIEEWDAMRSENMDRAALISGHRDFSSVTAKITLAEIKLGEVLRKYL